MTLLQAIVLGLVQGLGEFLPISSSAHLVLVPYLLGWPEHTLSFDVALHLGTLVAVAVYFWRDLVQMAVEGLTKGTRTPMGRIAWGVVVGTIPGAIVGKLLEKKVATTFRSPVQIAILLALMGVVLYVADRIGSKRRELKESTFMDVVWIGVAQAFAVIPGVSRSGATITAGLLRGLNREASARISFLLSFPIILGAGLLTAKDIPLRDINAVFISGVAVSAISGYLVIAFLMNFLKRGTYLGFAVYRIAMAALVLLVTFAGLR